MVEEQLVARGVSHPDVLEAMRVVPRHLFVQEALSAQAYADNPAPIGCGQTISQPYIVALMTELLEPQSGAKVLEIGTGSGYQAAVLAQLGMEVYTVERIPELYRQASKRLVDMRCFRVRFKLDDGTLGWPDEAPFDRILVTAGGPEIPRPLLDQLADPGILVTPVGPAKREQELVRIIKNNGKMKRESHGAVMFVDLVGRHGWTS